MSGRTAILTHCFGLVLALLLVPQPAAADAPAADVTLTPDEGVAGALVDVSVTLTNVDPLKTVDKLSFSLTDAHLVRFDAANVSGWTSSLVLGANDRPQTVTWSGGALAPSATVVFPVTVTLPSDRAQITLPAQLHYSDGTSRNIAGADVVPTLRVTGAVTTTTTRVATPTTSTVAPAPAGKSWLSVGNSLILFGAVVIILIVMRTKATANRRNRRRL